MGCEDEDEDENVDMDVDLDVDVSTARQLAGEAYSSQGPVSTAKLSGFTAPTSPLSSVCAPRSRSSSASEGVPAPAIKLGEGSRVLGQVKGSVLQGLEHATGPRNWTPFKRLTPHSLAFAHCPPSAPHRKQKQTIDMHVLVVNDDGPPGPASPYIRSFVDALLEAKHVVSVVLPASNMSGMAKAYDFGKVVQPRIYTPPAMENNDDTNNNGGGTPAPWILVDGTPATCVQLGIYHLFPDRPPVDLVVSGPNYGHNLTSVYNLASGTLGGGLEAALCEKRAVSLSFAFGNHLIPGEDGVHDAELISAACRLSRRLIEQLFQGWPAAVEVYHINVPPLRAPWDPPPVMWTTAVRSSLSSPSILRPLTGDDKPSTVGETDALQPWVWAPRFTDVMETLNSAPSGTDAWALKHGYIGIIPMQAYLREVPALSREVDLDLSN